MPRGPEQPDFYQTLGVSKDATAEEIKKRYWKHARELHPDVNSNPKAQEQFKEVAEAYETLSDPQSRTIYDRTRHNENIFSVSENPNLKTISDLFVLYIVSKAFTGLENLIDKMQKPKN